MTEVLVDAVDVAAETTSTALSWVTAEGVSKQVSLDEAAAVAFEDGLPVRRSSARKGQHHLCGRWWCGTTSTHVGFESWLERDHLMLLDFDPAVVAIAAQPFWLRWRDASGSTVRHAPDYFARRADGSAVVVDCRPVERRGEGDLAKFEATAQVSALLGWDYRVVGGLEPVLAANVRWLAGYRHPRHHHRRVAQLLQEVFVTPTPVIAGARAVGDPIAVLPVLFHLLWRHDLTAALSVPLHEQTLVHGSGVR